MRRWLLALLSLVVLLPAGMIVWLSTPYKLDAAAVGRALVSDARVSVSRETFLVFEPVEVAPRKGLIFYPGGKANPASYAPVLRELAGTGLLVVIVPMPLNLALLGHEQADAVMREFPQIEQWYLAGHSMGGVGAVEYAAEASTRLQGLVLWAAYPDRDISELELPVLSVYGYRDAMTTTEDVESRRHWLPAATDYRMIDADHWQFGHFTRGEQSSRHRAQREIIAVTLEFMSRGD